jgi:tRNA threonylcarbamoyladenosine biosynthesis protein TsaE
MTRLPTETKVLSSLEELQAEAAQFIRERAYKPHAEKLTHATLITLSGDLGAGKTSFVQGVAKALGIIEAVTSPTFVLQKSYVLPQNFSHFSDLIHIDAYRLEGMDQFPQVPQLTPLRFSEYYADPATLIVLEWPERVASELPPADVAISLAVLEDNTRSITYTYA